MINFWIGILNVVVAFVSGLAAGLTYKAGSTKWGIGFALLCILNIGIASLDFYKVRDYSVETEIPVQVVDTTVVEQTDADTLVLEGGAEI